MRLKEIIVFVLLLLFVGACSQSLYMQGRRHIETGSYDAAIDALYQEISANPQNALAWRELGVAYYEKGNLTKAEDALKQANNIKPDARTHLFLGLLYEKQSDYEAAIGAYTTSLALHNKGETATMTRAHLDALVTKQIQIEAATAISNESNIDTDTIPQHTIAVASFDGSYLPDELSPIARGMSEFTAIDLAKVRSLTVLDRLKLDVLLKELQLGQSGVVDQSTAPRVGRLMGTARLVTGSVLALGDDGLKLDGVVISTTDSSTWRTPQIEGQLENFFILQKQFVFSILDQLNIKLTAEERDAIEEVPTESYLAFLAYCRGLDYQSRGMNDAARQEFEIATQADQEFRLAELELGSIIYGSGGYEQSRQRLESSIRRDPGQGSLSDIGLDRRLSNILNNMGGTPFRRGDIPPTLRPPVTSITIRLIIRGNLDAL